MWEIPIIHKEKRSWGFLFLCLFKLWGWLNTGTGYPERLGDLCPCRCLRPDWTWPWAIGPHWTYLEQALGLDNYCITTVVAWLFLFVIGLFVCFLYLIKCLLSRLIIDFQYKKGCKNSWLILLLMSARGHEDNNSVCKERFRLTIRKRR